MGFISTVFGLSPYIEVVARRIYWSSPWLIQRVNKSKHNRKNQESYAATTETFHRIENFLKSHGVGKGTLLVVHSSANVLTRTGYSGSQIVDRLLELVGSEGTLAMPAIPMCLGEPKGIERITSDVSELELEYDVKKSIPWTGVLPFLLMNVPRAKRSCHPLNTMVAVGPLAEPMMQDNLAGVRPLACGPTSSWKFCVDHDAIIAALGVDLAHSLTMIHVAEDSYEDQWPVSEWYRERKFRIVENGTTRNVVVRERHPKWAGYFAERTLSKDLRRAGILSATTIDDIPVGVIPAKRLLGFLNERKSKGYPYFMIPRGNQKSK